MMSFLQLVSYRKLSLNLSIHLSFYISISLAAGNLNTMVGLMTCSHFKADHKRPRSPSLH